MGTGSEPSRLPARVAPYVDAVGAARQRGYTWGDLAVLFGTPSAENFRRAVVRARAAIQSGRLVVTQIADLPETSRSATSPPRKKVADAPTESHGFCRTQQHNPVFDDDNKRG